MTTATKTPPKQTAVRSPITKSAAEIDKLLAEAEQARAAAVESLSASREYDANVVTAGLEQKKIAHLIEQSRVEAECAKLTLNDLQRSERFRSVSDVFNATFQFDDPVTSKSVRACLSTLVAWQRSSPKTPITLNISTDGGSVIDGLHLIDGILAIRRGGTTVNTVALGLCASMGVPILCAGERRYMGKYATLLLHEGSLGAVGTRGEVEDTVAMSDKLFLRCLQLMSERAMPINPSTTVTFLKKFVKRKDVTLTADESLALGIVDEIL